MRLSIASLLIACAVVATPAAAKEPVHATRAGAIGGYDPVAYFTQGKPVEGRENLAYEWKGATWRFASERARAAFVADPERYAPQYGGYCAWAVSKGYTAGTDPDAWRIVDGKLYLNYSKSVQARWEKDIPGHIARADANWPGVLE